MHIKTYWRLVDPKTGKSYGFESEAGTRLVLGGVHEARFPSAAAAVYAKTFDTPIYNANEMCPSWGVSFDAKTARLEEVTLTIEIEAYHPDQYPPVYNNDQLMWMDCYQDEIAGVKTGKGSKLGTIRTKSAGADIDLESLIDTVFGLCDEELIGRKVIVAEKGAARGMKVLIVEYHPDTDDDFRYVI